MRVAPLVTVTDLRKGYSLRTDFASLFSRRGSTSVEAVDGLSFSIARGEIVGLIGESGSGKTTVARLLLGLEEPDTGEIRIGARVVRALRGEDRKRFYRNVQMIFQDPYASLNPRFTVLETVLEPLRAQKIGGRAERLDRAEHALERSGLRPADAFFPKYPHQLSGGERQRLSIARALVLEPRFLVADEPVSMLDVSIKAGILNLLRSLSLESGLSMLYISHDLSTVKYLCDRTLILFRGALVEAGAAEAVIGRPLHPYAQALRAAIPGLDTGTGVGAVPWPIETKAEAVASSGCRYRLRCPYAQTVCADETPRLREIEPGRFAACHVL